MKSLNLVVVGATLVVLVLAWDVFGATIQCPKCDSENLTSKPKICAQEDLPDSNFKYMANFKNFCEMLQFNCNTNRGYYMISQGERCENITGAWGRKIRTDKMKN